MRALYITSELAPLAKTGGLADVSATLPLELSKLGIDVRILLPAYPQALERAGTLKEIARFGNVLGCGGTRLLETHLANGHMPVWLVDCPELFNRDGGPYQDRHGVDWQDNHLRFALLSHVAAGIANEAGATWRPDILHANDWHAGLVPLFTGKRKQSGPATIFTIHNLAYQGLFDASCFDSLHVPSNSFDKLEFHGRISFMKAGIKAANAITTVSATYAREILTPEYGFGLDGLLRERAAVLEGILNGADYGLWDPKCDPHIVRPYTSNTIALKRACKEALQQESGLAANEHVPLVCFMSRLAHQKMPDVVLQALPELLKTGVQFALVAEGDPQYHDAFRELAARYPGQVSAHIGYEEPLAHRLIAGADMLLHPARFEPCGLVPLYAMRYGAIPIVRKSGGVADTVVDATPESLKNGTATGFFFDAVSSTDLVTAVHRALSLYSQTTNWRRLQFSAMNQDFSWSQSAQRYASLYQSLAEPMLDPSEMLQALRVAS